MTDEEINFYYARLPVIYWPVFWWALIWFERWLVTRNKTGLVVHFKVTRRGRIIIVRTIDGVAPPVRTTRQNISDYLCALEHTATPHCAREPALTVSAVCDAVILTRAFEPKTLNINQTAHPPPLQPCPGILLRLAPKSPRMSLPGRARQIRRLRTIIVSPAEPQQGDGQTCCLFILFAK